jgi:cell division protein FtsB
MTDNKQKRLQSLDQDVVSVPSAFTRRATDKGGKNARGAGGTLMLLLLVVTILAALAVGAISLVNMQQRIDSLQVQITELKPAADIVSLQAKSSFLEGQLMLLDQRLDQLQKAPQPAVAESRERSDGFSHSVLSEVNARVRKLDIESDRLKTSVDGLASKLAALQLRTQRVESLTDSQGAILAQQLSPEIQQQSELEKAAQLEQIDSQLERLNNDVRSIYRMLEMGR